MLRKETSAHSTFRRRLIHALEPIRQAFLAQTILAMFDSGMAEALCARSYSAEDLAGALGLQPHRVLALLRYASNERLVVRSGTSFSASQYLKELMEFMPWYELLVGGYGQTLLDLPSLLRGTQYGARNVSRVGHGSSGVSEYDTIPVVMGLLSTVPSIEVIADLGSADASYLLRICSEYPRIRGIAVEPDPQSAERAKQVIASHNMAHRISVHNVRVQDFATVHHDVDCYILAFVLQEVLAQEGREHVVALLQSLVQRSRPVHLIVIEVNYNPDSFLLRSGLGRNYYNPYFLFHELTEQQLCSHNDWLSIFADAGCHVLALASPSIEVDSTQFEEAFLIAAEAP